MITSKLSAKRQSTIPGEVLKFLGPRAGDPIGYESPRVRS